MEVLERVLRAQLRRGAWFLLVKGTGFPDADATWEPLTDFKLAFPDFQLEDELFIQAGSNVMVDRVYERRGRSG